jgi:hypothetical protein
MYEKKLRAEVAKRRKLLKRSEDGGVPERTWSFVSEMGWLHEASEMFDEEAVEYIVGWLDRLDAVAPGSYTRRMTGRHSGGEHDEEDDRKEKHFEVELGDYEKERQKAFAEVMTRFVGYNEDAEGKKEVANFRRDLFGGFSPKQRAGLCPLGVSGCSILPRLVVRKAGNTRCWTHLGNSGAVRLGHTQGGSRSPRRDPCRATGHNADGTLCTS